MLSWVSSIQLHLGCLLINENLVLPFYVLFFGCSASSFLCVCVCNSVCHVDVVVFCDVSLIFLFFNVCLGSLLYIYVLWLLWVLYYKCLINKTVLFLLKAFYLQLSIWFLSFSFPSCVFLLSQITDFYAVSLLPNRSSHSYSYCFLIFNL